MSNFAMLGLRDRLRYSTFAIDFYMLSVACVDWVFSLKQG